MYIYKLNVGRGWGGEKGFGKILKSMRGELKKLVDNEEFYDLNVSPSMIKVTKLVLC
jgi:hypothetical protein